MNTLTAHTPADLARFEAERRDPDTVQPRERAVSCVRCKRDTWNVNARCDRHQA